MIFLSFIKKAAYEKLLRSSGSIQRDNSSPQSCDNAGDLLHGTRQ